MVPFIRDRVSGRPFAFGVSFPWMLDFDPKCFMTGAEDEGLDEQNATLTADSIWEE